MYATVADHFRDTQQSRPPDSRRAAENLERLQQTLVETRELTGKLASRLEQVLKPAGPRRDGDDPNSRPGIIAPTSPLADVLNAMTADLSAVRAQITDLIERLDI